MDAILQTAISNYFFFKLFFLTENVCNLIQISLSYVSMDPINTSTGSGNGLENNILVNIGSGNGFTPVMLTYCQFDPQEQISEKFQSKYLSSAKKKCIRKYCGQNVTHFVKTLLCSISSLLMWAMEHFMHSSYELNT